MECATAKFVSPVPVPHIFSPYPNPYPAIDAPWRVPGFHPAFTAHFQQKPHSHMLHVSDMAVSWQAMNYLPTALLMHPFYNPN